MREGWTGTSACRDFFTVPLDSREVFELPGGIAEVFRAHATHGEHADQQIIQRRVFGELQVPAALQLSAAAADADVSIKLHKRVHANNGLHLTSTPIACTRVGCIPIQPGCYVRPGTYFFFLSGELTGYDVVVCEGQECRVTLSSSRLRVDWQ